MVRETALANSDWSIPNWICVHTHMCRWIHICTCACYQERTRLWAVQQLPSHCSCSCSFVIANASANVNQMRQCDQNSAVAATASPSWTETAQAEMNDEANHAGTDAAFPPMPVPCCRNAWVAAGPLVFALLRNQCTGWTDVVMWVIWFSNNKVSPKRKLIEHKLSQIGKWPHVVSSVCLVG